MDIRKLQRAIVDGLEDVKAHDIVVLNTEQLSPLFERVIIASGTSNRQTKALASSVRETVKSRGMQVLATEGEATGEWIIVDCGAAVAHIMQPAVREYYHLEEIWGGKPVRMKLAAASIPAAARSAAVRAAGEHAAAVEAVAAPRAVVSRPGAGSARVAPAARPPAARKVARRRPVTGAQTATKAARKVPLKPARKTARP